MLHDGGLGFAVKSRAQLRKQPIFRVSSEMLDETGHDCSRDQIGEGCDEKLMLESSERVGHCEN